MTSNRFAPRPARRATRDRAVHRDDRGYYFDVQAVSWVAVTPPTIAWASASPEIADLLQIPAGSEVLVRDRQIGERGGPPLQLAISYLPGPLVRGTVLEQADTGPGGIYDRPEEMGHTLHWIERITTRMAGDQFEVAYTLERAPTAQTS
ncbi:MAG: hypothetical protein ACRDTT_02495 [Pseudonocardiaceae bacterium]